MTAHITKLWERIINDSKGSHKVECPLGKKRKVLQECQLGNKWKSITGTCVTVTQE